VNEVVKSPFSSCLKIVKWSSEVVKSRFSSCLKIERAKRRLDPLTTIELLEKQGYQYIYTPDIAPVILTDLQMDIPGIMENLGKIEVKNG